MTLRDMVAWRVCPGEEAIAAYVAGRLPRGEREQVDSHLDTCSACQELVAMLAKGIGPAGATRDVTSLGGGGATPGAGAEHASEWNPGATLGRYALLAPIGAGGMGVVYAAYDPELDRRVAVKVLRRARRSDDLRAEARAVARLAHPNVIAVHDVGEIDGEVYVAMEYVDGQSVREWLRTARSPAQILDVFVQAGRGLAAAHRAGLVHRDIKPSNIVVGADGRARVLDFGLAMAAEPTETEAQGSLAGTPAYMAPEQLRRERVDARADQYAFCVALWEALGGSRDRGTGDAVEPHARGELRDVDDRGPRAKDRDRAAAGSHARGELRDVDDRVQRAIRRGLSAAPEQRFATMDELLAELAPPAPTDRGLRVAGGAVVIAIGALAVAGVVLRRAQDRPAPCATAGDRIGDVWNDRARAELRAGFAATKLAYAPAAADRLIVALDGWTAAWRDQARASCKATLVDRVQPASTDALRTSCLDELRLQVAPVVELGRHADAQVVARAAALADALPAPARCADVAGLSALPPMPPGEGARTLITALLDAISSAETDVRAGRAATTRSLAIALRERAEAIGYLPLRARATLLTGRIEVALGNYAAGEAQLHEAARLATAARDLELLADTWIELAQVLGNDPRTTDEAELFFGYADAVIAQLPARAERQRAVDLARCNVNVTAKDTARPAAACQRVIDAAEHLQPPDRAAANAARVRLGHYMRMQGHAEQALSMIRRAAEEAVELHGANHPDTAVAYNALGIAEISAEDYEHGIPDLRRALAIREAVFPGDSLQLAESLLGLGDALGASGSADESIAVLERGLSMLDRLHQDDSAQAANAHILVGMSLQDAKRPGDALPHFVKAADIADRSLEHREALAAMALRLAASVENDQGRVANGIPYLERALGLVERAKAPPEELGRTQLALGQFLLDGGGATQRGRALALLSAARANIVAAGPAAADLAAELDAFARSHHLQIR